MAATLRRTVLPAGDGAEVRTPLAMSVKGDDFQVLAASSSASTLQGSRRASVLRATAFGCEADRRDCGHFLSKPLLSKPLLSKPGQLRLRD
jgi:hypothetical protein